MNPVLSGVTNAPTAMLVVGAMAGITAQITDRDKAAVRQSIIVTSAVVVLASFIGGGVPAGVASAISVGAVVYLTRPIWEY